MAITFSNTDQSDEDGLNIMSYGEPGVGKTRFIATMPDPIIISAERGNLSLKGYNIPVIYVRSGVDLQQAFDYLTTDKRGREFKSIAWDSVTDSAQSILNISMSAKTNGQQAYGEMADVVMKYFKMFRDLRGRHKLFVSQLTHMKDATTGSFRGLPSFPGKQLDQNTPYLPDMVLRFFAQTNEQNKEKIDYLIQTKPDEFFMAKDRSGALPRFIPQDFRAILYYIDQAAKARGQKK